METCKTCKTCKETKSIDEQFSKKNINLVPYINCFDCRERKRRRLVQSREQERPQEREPERPQEREPERPQEREFQNNEMNIRLDRIEEKLQNHDNLFNHLWAGFDWIFGSHS